MAAGLVLVAVGGIGILLSLALLLYGLFSVPNMSNEKKASESLILLGVAAWCGGFVVAGKLLRRT